MRPFSHCSAVPFAVFVILAAIAAVPSRADAQSRIDITPVHVAVPLVQQDTPMWCWLAVADMVIQSETHTVWQQCTMLDAAAGFPQGTCCADPYGCMLGATSRHIQELLWTFGRVPSHEVPLPLSFGALRDVLAAGRPVIAQVRQECAPLAHVVVIVGVSFQKVRAQTPAGVVTFITPMVTVNDPQVPKPVTMPYTEFQGMWFGSIIIDSRTAPNSTQ